MNLPQALIKKIWASYRLKKILRNHRSVVNFWRPLIAQYKKHELPISEIRAKKNNLGSAIIWQYWGQGFEDAKIPEVVQICRDSVDRYSANYQVIRLDDNNFEEYLEFPDHIIEKLKLGIINRTFFSDLLRLALLNAYGGIWMDATIFLSGPIPSEIINTDYFFFQRDPQESNKKYWENSYAQYWGWHPHFRVNMLNSFMIAKKGNKLIRTMLDLMCYYWLIQNKAITYFFFQILYDELVSSPTEFSRPMLISDVFPHYLQETINGSLTQYDYNEIIQCSSIHKLTYFSEPKIILLKKLINQ